MNHATKHWGTRKFDGFAKGCSSLINFSKLSEYNSINEKKRRVDIAVPPIVTRI
jgi:hypothetical protein